jgi:hypothetical protein
MQVQNRRDRWLAGAFVAALTLSMSPAHGQTTPKIKFLFPPGAQRGTEVDVEFRGEYMPQGCQLSSAQAGLVLRPSDAGDRYYFTIAADSVAGPREIRLSSVQGASAPFPFLIGELPEIIHSDADEPRDLTLPVTANGRLDAKGDIDEYFVTLSAGAQIVCAASTQAIRSPVDPMLRLLDHDGNILATSGPHRSADALLVFRAAKEGRYRLQVFDFQMAGSARHIYRLTVTDGAWLDYAVPHGLVRDLETVVKVKGWNLPSAQEGFVELKIPPQPVGQFHLTLPGSSNRLTLPVGENPEVTEIEPNNIADNAMELPFPSTVNGRLQDPEDLDVYSCPAKKGERFVIDVDSADLKFETDVVMTVSNEAGKPLSEVDDTKTSPDPGISFTAPADGRYFISIRDRSGDGSDDYIYRLHLSPLRPDVTARVNVPSLMLHSGQTVNLPVRVTRVDGLASELEITAVGLPAGVEVTPQPVPAKTPATIQLPFVVADTTAPISSLVQIVVRDAKAGPSSDRIAMIAESAAAKSGSRDLWLAVSPEIPFTLSIAGPILDAPQMAGFPFPVKVTRKEGFAGVIRLVGVEPDRRGTLIPLTGQIPALSDAGTIPLVIQHEVTEGTTHRSRVMGVAEVPGLDGKVHRVFHVAKGAMAVGCAPSLLTMSTEPGILIRRPGEVQQIEVRLMRRVTMQPVTIRLSLPPEVVGIECDPVKVGADQDRATLMLRFAPNATVPRRVSIGIEAESSRDGLPIYGKCRFRLETR